MTQRADVTYAVNRGREAGVAAEDPEDADPLVAAERRPLPVDRLLRPGDRGREADAVLGPLDVVVHRLRDRDEGNALVHEDLRVGQRVVATDRHQDVDAERGQVIEDERRQVVAIVIDGVPRSLVGAHPWRQPGLAHLPRVRSRRVEDRPAGPFDGPRVRSVERAKIVGIELGRPGWTWVSPSQPRRMPRAV